MKVIRMTEADLHNIIKESVDRILKENEGKGLFGYPILVDHIILDCDNDRECYDMYNEIKRMVISKAEKGFEISPEILVNSSAMRKYQQFVFRKFKQDQIESGHYDKVLSPKAFREYKTKQMIDEIGEMMGGK